MRVVASADTWIEGEALRQLDAVASLPGMTKVAGLPDLHPGKGGPVGAAFLSEGIVRPTLVGSDIGCGMALWGTDLRARKVRPDKIAKRLDGLDEPWDGDAASWLVARGIEPTPYDSALGTVGHGNHFCEFQVVHEIRDEEAAAGLGIDRDRVLLLVHSGSRGLGESILRNHGTRFRAEGLRMGTRDAEDYLAEHDAAVAWAKANRELVARRALDAVGAKGEPILDVCHNDVTVREVAECQCLLHRKGACPSDRGPVVIPGSRGDFSVVAIPDASRDDALWSLAHGAGRKLARHEAKGKLSGRHRRDELLVNRFGGRLVCGDDRLLWEEASEAYKDLKGVVTDLEGAGLLRVVAVSRPLVTFKCSFDKGGDARRDKDARMRERREERTEKGRRRG